MRLARSIVDEGSLFILYLPQYDFNDLAFNNERGGKNSLKSTRKRLEQGRHLLGVINTENTEILDDRSLIQPGDRVLLIVEDDPDFAKIILDLAREKGFKGIVALRGSQLVTLARNYKPDAITLDIRMPDI